MEEDEMPKLRPSEKRKCELRRRAKQNRRRKRNK